MKIKNNIEYENIAKVEEMMDELAHDLEFKVDIGVTIEFSSQLDELRTKCFSARNEYQKELINKNK
jgi:hypothetical protein